MDTPFNIFESSPAAYDRYRQGNPLRGIPWPKNPLKALWEKEKLLVTTMQADLVRY